mmetsp:Transcript_63157/g.131335  ORF Transcript_63157/g.131335 Transcript_63157/m.131335 type:complete len:313 (-) Transcript_63157:191-1129(-)|eukprot:CAMPEP_0181289968 /NCGR_PEP_ID=MMETSP1101-20121128/1169_1 /TAXON_ID=46948 /ORGANISM="Rhodomonas abbreviata, Strain Caron Lab Isolate" /LENGTH=312 /DNA_ID=CAMNT_0023394233 /DNA_START=31 /DNA_END=969 /DNA_ORIENTATION=-
MSAPTWDVLERQDDVASKTAIEFLENCDKKEAFIKLAESETKLTVDRDNQDADALKAGIKFAQDKGVLTQIEPAPYTMIDVMGKTATMVAEMMVKQLGECASTGCVLVLVGLSGTGKGTTMDKLKSMLPKAMTWSNGNIFRSLTLLACQHCEKNGVDLSDLESQLSAENLKAWMSRLNFGKFNGSDEWDVEVTQLDGGVVYVSQVCNTLLKEPRISKNIPTVAKCTQGEVVLFAADACTRMGADGSVVLVEGREETVNFIPTQFRFCLTMSDMQIIGKRRAVQRVVAEAIKLKGGAANLSASDALVEVVGKL